MSKTGAIASGVLGGATTKIARSLTRRALHEKSGAPRVPRRARDRQGIAVMLAWAAAVGVILALADVLLEQRRASAELDRVR